MKKLLLFLCSLISYLANAQTFTELATANLTDVTQSAVAWGDYDNDGDLDVLLTGRAGSPRVSKIYTNTAGTFTELATANLTGVNNSAVAWGDYDNDGDLDVLLTGWTGSTPISKIYTNTAGTFTELTTANLTGVYYSAIAWGDYDNDGDLDILLTGNTGSTRVSKIYTNTAGTFTELATANLTEVTDSAVAWGDYDNDGDLDILLTGYTGSVGVSKIYTNTAGTFTELATANLAQVSFSSVAWGDYDDDGDLDIVLTGIEGVNTSISKIYTNTAGTFTELATANLTGVNVGAASWGDYDNDGDLDVLLNGWTPSGNISKIYTNTAGTFTELATANFPGVSFGRSAWGDYDNDGDLDVLLTGEFPTISKIFTNNTVTPNTVPTAPTNPTAIVNKDEVTLSWTASNDAETPSSGLSYNVFIKDASASTSSAYTVSPMAQENNGWRKLPALGNAQQNTSYTWKLPQEYHGTNTNFTFKVQAIDHSFVGSAFSAEGTFSVDLRPFTELGTANLIDLLNSSTAWGDYDNDGDLDVLITGLESFASNLRYSKIYTNNGGAFTELTSVNLPGIADGSVAWGDYDNDGDLDILLSGGLTDISYTTKIYTNTNGIFTELTSSNLPSVGFRSVAWGDYDNDGDLDILMTGGTSKIYTNNGGTFTELATANLLDVSDSSATWGDYDNDGDLDVLLTGYTGSTDISKIYTNTNGVFTELISANLIGISYSSVAWGDYDNDGDLDILMTGLTGSTTVSKIYTNNGGSFIELATANLPSLQHSAVAWGDYDNDGDLDVLLSGVDGGTRITRVYTNTTGIFSELVSASLQGGQYGSVAWGDYDNDSDLDILVSGVAPDGTGFSKIYTNNTVIPNTVPTVPTNPTAVVNENEVTISWTASTDAETPSSGLSYNVFIKESPVGSPEYVKSPIAQENDGWRKLPAIGNTGQNTSYIWKLPEEYHNTNKDFTFKIQAIDHSFAGSEFSTEGTFSIVDLRKFIELDTANLTNVFQSAVAWGDYDNDGDLDLLVTGKKSISVSTDPISTIYTNTNGTFTALATANLIGVQSGAVEWGDYDNDGDLDILLTGLAAGNINVAKIYTNNGGSFTELATANLPGIAFGDVAWGDYDNDGDLDIFLTGGISKIFTNDAGTFTELATASFPRLSSGSVDWGDYDNDGDLDILLTGYTGSLDISKIYTNTNGVFTELTSANLTGVSYSSTAWGDYDNDGDLDVLLSGYTGSARVTKIYTNTAGNFTELATANLLGVQEGSIAWGDYDNDGDLDILLTGSGGNASTRVYVNSAGVFTQLITDDLPGLVVSDAVWGDYDNDGDLDIALAGVTNSSFISKIFINNIATANTAPTAPTNPTAVVNGDEITLSWTASTDVETPSSGLGYNIYIKDASTSSAYIVSPMAQENDGWRKLPAIGNAQQNTSYVYKLPATCTTNYTFKVQAIDHSFAGSEFSREGNFSTTDTTNPTIITQDITVQLDALGNVSITPAQIDNGSSDNCGIQSMSLDTTAFDCTHVGTNTVTLTVTDVNGNSDTNTAIVTVEDNSMPHFAGSWGTGTLADPFTTISEGILKYLPSGRYYFSFNNATFLAELDNDTDGGAWLMVLNYVHVAGDNPDLEIRNTDLPLLNSSTLGDNEANTANWGHIGNTLAAAVDFKELRFYGKTTGHSREIHFKTQYIKAINYIKTGVGDFRRMGHGNYTTLVGHTANLPQSMGWGHSDQGDLALTNFPFYLSNQYHWGIKGVGSRWEVDDFARNAESTIHRVWVRGDSSPAVTLPLVTIALDATGNATVSPTDFGLTAQDNCGGVITQTLSKTGFDCTNLGENIVRLHATDAEGNVGTIDVTVIVEDPIVPILTCPSDITLGTDPGVCEATVTVPVPAIIDNCALPPATIPGFTTIGVKGGSTYYVSNTNFTGPEAFADAKVKGGYVATIETAEEDQFITDYQAAQGLSDITIGLYDLTFSGTFVWHSQSTATYTNWNSSEPNNIGREEYTEKVRSNGSWNNIPRSVSQPYILEIKGGLERTDALVGESVFPIGDHTIEYTVTDSFGNTDTCNFIITVEDDEPINVQCVAPFVVNLDVTGNASITVRDIDNGSTDNCGITSIAIDKTNFDCTQLGDHTVTLTATNTHGHQASCTTIITVADNIPPLYLNPFGTGTPVDPFTTISQDILKNVPSGRYYFNFNNSTFQAELDNDTDGGGWLMVLNYVRKADDNPDLQIRNADLPLLTSSTLNDDESNTSYWGHIGNTLASAINFNELRFYATTTGHNREVHFKTQYTNAIDYIKTGTGNFIGINQGNFTALAGHTSNLPQMMNGGFSDQGDLALTSFPFYRGNEYHWGIKGVGRRWEVDDFSINAESTIHRVWIRSNETLSFTIPTVTMALDASGNATLTPAHYGLNPIENCGSTVTQTLSKTGFDCTEIGEHTLQLTATDVSGNSSTIDVKVTIEDQLVPAVVIQDITVQLDASGNAAITSAQIDNGSTDNCGIQSMSLDTTSFDCTHVGANTVTLTVTDVNGNSATNTAIVTVEDNIVPSVVTQNITIQLNASENATITPSQIDNGSTDNCGIQSIGLDVTSFDCTHVGANTVTLTVTDVNGNSATNTAIVTVEDNIAPSVVTQDITVQLDTSGNVSITSAQIDNGSSDNCGIQSMSLDTTSFDCTHVGANTVILTVTDVNGNSDTNTAIVTVEDNIVPSVVTQNITIQLNASGNASITVAQIDNGSSDNCGIQSMSIDTTSFDCTNVGTNTVSLTVTDVNGNSATNTATVTVEDNVAPSVATQDITVQLDTSGNVSITSAQIDNGSSDACGIQSMSLDTTSFDCTHVGINTVTLTVTDVNGNSDTNTAIVTVEDNIVPSVVTQNITVQLDTSGNATITPDQIDNGSTVNCGIQSIGLDVTSFDCTHVGANTVILTVTDVNGNSDTNTAIVTVEDNIVPSVVTQNITIQLNASGNATITPDQIDNGSTVNCGIQSIGLDVTSFDCTHVGANTVTLTVTDANGNSDTNTAIVTVEDNIVPSVVTQNITVQLYTSGNASITSAQIDNGSSDNCGIQSMSLDTTSFDCTHVGANTVILTVTDVNGNSATNTATVTVEDNIAPSVVTQDITVQLDTSGNASITAAQIDNGSSDNCGIQSMSLDTTTFDCTNIGVNTVTLTVTDVNGNLATNTAIVTVEDRIQPIVVCQDITIQLDATGNATITPTDIDNGSNDACGVVLTLSKTQFSLVEVGVHTVTLTATDPSGNTSSCNALVTVEDNIPPVITLLGDDLQIITKGSGYTELGAITNDGSEVVINSSDFMDATGTYYISYNAMDSNGNIAEEVIRTVIVNNPNPTLEVFPNPASDYIRILNFENLEDLGVYDMTGKKIYQFNKQQLQEYIKVHHLPEGVYWLRGYFMSKGFVYKKIMIKH